MTDRYQNWLRIVFQDIDKYQFLKARWNEREPSCPVGLWGLIYPEERDKENWRLDNWGVEDEMLDDQYMSWRDNENTLELLFTDKVGIPTGVYHWLRRWWDVSIYAYYYDLEKGLTCGLFVYEDGKLIYDTEYSTYEFIEECESFEEHWICSKLNACLSRL